MIGFCLFVIVGIKYQGKAEREKQIAVKERPNCEMKGGTFLEAAGVSKRFNKCEIGVQLSLSKRNPQSFCKQAHFPQIKELKNRSDRDCM